MVSVAAEQSSSLTTDSKLDWGLGFDWTIPVYLHISPFVLLNNFVSDLFGGFLGRHGIVWLVGVLEPLGPFKTVV